MNINSNIERTLYFTNGKKSASIVVTIRHGRLSISGDVFRGKRLLRNSSNLSSSGQCIDEAADLLPSELIAIWRRWHLNDMRAGTPTQEALLREVEPELLKSGDYYSNACAYLEAHGLLIDNGYKFGTAWLHEELPEAVIEYVKNLPAQD